MNCKQGDLAIVVRSLAGNEGKVVECVRFVGAVPGMNGEDYWLTNRVVPTVLGSVSRHLRDSCLRPIRPGDISDEEVRDLYAPNTTKEAA